MNDPTIWLLSDIPERPDYYSSRESFEDFEDEMNRADELSRANYDDETTEEGF